MDDLAIFVKVSLLDQKKQSYECPSTSGRMLINSTLILISCWYNPNDIKSNDMRYIFNGIYCMIVKKAMMIQTKGHNTDHDDVIKWKPCSRYWPFVRGIHWWPVKSPHQHQWLELWCFLWSGHVPTVEQTMETPVIWDTMALIITSL